MNQTSSIKPNPTSDDAYRGGIYRIGLAPLFNWYNRVTMKRGKDHFDNHIEDILSLLIPHLLSEDPIEEDELKYMLNMDCIVGHDAQRMEALLKTGILSSVLGVFPKLGSYIPHERYYLLGRELIIDVPDLYEEQIGYFF